jgi:hypothetical protein
MGRTLVVDQSWANGKPAQIVYPPTQKATPACPAFAEAASRRQVKRTTARKHGSLDRG